MYAMWGPGVCPWHHGNGMMPVSNETGHVAPQELGLGLVTKNKRDRFFFVVVVN